jgi:Carboxypeptidase regulatory-like domain
MMAFDPSQERSGQIPPACRVKIASQLRRALVLAAFASASLSAQSNGVIQGTIVDQSGRGIAGAQATLAPPGRHGVSDDEGLIQFADLGPGIYTLSVRRIGFEPASVRVVLRVAAPDTVARTTVTLVAIPRLLDSVRISERVSGLRYSAALLDQYDRPVPGAEVIAMGIESDVVTDSAGHFSIGKLGKAALIVRVRKIGYSPVLQSMRMLADRTDTLRMTRLATSLTPVQIREASGYGMDFWAYRELQSRMAWKSPRGGAIAREELDARGKQDLCDALPGTASGARYSLHNDPNCKLFPRGIKNLLIDGAMCRKGLLADYVADQVEMVEYVPTDMSGSLAARRCGPPAFVIWLRKPPVRAAGPP